MESIPRTQNLLHNLAQCALICLDLDLPAQVTA